MLAARCTWRRDNFLLSPGIGIGSLRVNAFVACLRRLDDAFVFSRSVRLVTPGLTRRGKSSSLAGSTNFFTADE
jgi:hypothetical protein